MIPCDIFHFWCIYAWSVEIDVSHRASIVKNWDNIRYFLALARTGSLSGAARSLGVNHSTVIRRLAAFEASIGARLFARERNERLLTPVGKDILPLAEQIEKNIQQLDQTLKGKDTNLSGVIRVTTTDTLASTLMPSLIASFRAAYPEINIVLIIDNQVIRLSKNADVSIRPARAPEEDLVGRPVCNLAHAIYCAPRYLEKHNTPNSLEDLKAHDWVVPDPSLENYPVVQWTREHLSAARIAASSASILSLAALVRSGLGIAMLPCFLADDDPQLVRLSKDVKEVTSKLWLLTHSDLRGCTRIRKFREFTFNFLSRQSELIEGNAPSLSHSNDLI